MLSLGGELTIAIRNGLKRSAVRLVEKEEDLVRLEKQLDEALVEENGTRRKLNESEKASIKREIGKLVREGSDYSSKLAIRVNKALDKSPEDIKKYEDLFKTKEFEWGGAYNKRTKYKDYHTSNLPDQIIWPNRIIENLEGCIVTHNHPNGSGLSIADLKFFLSNKLTEIRAVRPDGSVFSLKNGKILSVDSVNFINYEDDLDLILKRIKMIEKDYTMMYKFSIDNTEKIDAKMFNEIFDLIKDKVTYTHYVH